MVNVMSWKGNPTFIAVSILALIVSASALYMIYSHYATSSVGTAIGGKALEFPSGIPASSGLGTAVKLGASQLYLEQEYSGRFILVTGSGVASAKADEATVTLGVQTESKTASEASRLNAELMTKIIEAIEKIGIPKDDIKTVSYSIYPVHSPKNYTQIIAYRTSNIIAVKVRRMDLVGRVIDTAVKSGANIVRGVSFGLSSSKQAELKSQAYISALKDAENKASLIAKTLNVKITGVRFVKEISYQPYQPYRAIAEYAMAAEGAKTPILEGKLTVTVTLQVMYSIE